MRTKLLSSLSLAALLIPLSTFAIDFTDTSSGYTDGPFTRPERVAISVLTNAGVVEGNPDGSFAANRTLNRAEFTKIALLAAGVDPGDAKSCFPDVRSSDWFSVYVCKAKDLGAVQGNPDGKFHPERPVNYAEALKILVELMGYDLPAVSNPWYQRYVEAAQDVGTAIPTYMAPDHLVTRGEMARIAAAFMAESEGQLDDYRNAEQGSSSSSSSVSSSSSSSSSTSSSTSSSSSSSSTSSSSSSVSSTSNIPDFPSRSRLLQPSETTKALLGGAFATRFENLIPTEAFVEFDREVRSIDALFLIDGSGTVISQLSLDIYDSTKKTWKATISESTYRIPKDTERVLGIIARMRNEDGFISQELFKANTFRMTFVGEDSHTTYSSSPSSQIYPSHQTAFGTVTSVQNAGPETGVLSAGNDVTVGRFSFTGMNKRVLGHTRITELNFTVVKSNEVSVTNWRILIPGTASESTCSISGTNLSCSLTEDLGTLSATPKTLEVRGNVSVGNTSSQYLQLTLQEPGTITTVGAVRWNDSAYDFSWLPLPSPLARGTNYR